MQYRRISADCHLDLPWLPRGLFVENSVRALKDRMPFVEDGPDGPQWKTKAGVAMGGWGGVGSVGGKFVPGQNYRVDKMAETGLYEAGSRGEARPGDPHLRIKEMEKDGVDAEIIFGILGVVSRLEDHEAAAKEVHRVAKMGLRGLELSCSWDMEPMWHPMWDPLWKAVNDVQLPLHFHTFPSMPPRVRANLPPNMRRQAQFTSVAGFQMNLINIIAAIIGAGVLERYPNLRVSFGESGIGWIPYALDRMDFEFEDRFRDLMKLKPSEYWQRQCKATFQYDVIGPKLVNVNNLMTTDTLMWGSDYPHTDGIWPESTKYIEEQF